MRLFRYIYQGNEVGCDIIITRSGSDEDIKRYAMPRIKEDNS